MIDDILSRLDKVKRTGRNSWLACCPAHDDSHPSLSITEGENGGVVARCHSQQCGINAIVDAVGLGWEPWFPPKAPEGYDFKPPIRRPFPAADVLEALAFECLVVAVSAEHLAQGKELDKEARGRLMVCVQRIEEARSFALGNR